MPTRPPRAHANGQPPKPAPRASAHARGYTTKWDEARKGFLAKHPRCECPAHKGRPNAPPATVVHHITPHKGDRTLFWQRSNWMPMAKPCHDSHTGRHDRPTSRARHLSPAEDGQGGESNLRAPTPPGRPAVPVSSTVASFRDGGSPSTLDIV